MNKTSFGDRLRYRFDNFMSRGTVALVCALFAGTFLLILVGTLVLVLARLKPRRAARRSVSRRRSGRSPCAPSTRARWPVTPGGRSGSSASPSPWAASSSSSALIGVLASGLEGRLNDLRRGRSRVVEAGHTVILGWSPKCSPSCPSSRSPTGSGVSDRGSSTVGHNACVVILADEDKVEMEEEIRTKVPDTLGTRVVCRSGSPLDLDDRADGHRLTRARAIILVSPGGQYPDLPVAKTLMALAKDRVHRTHRYHIVTALHRPTNLQITRMIGGDEAQVFLVDGLISRLIAQTCRQSGLSVVYGELFSFEGAAIHFHEASSLAGITYGEALSRFRNATLIGLQYRGWAGPGQPTHGDRNPARRQRDRHRNRRRGSPSFGRDGLRR